MDQRTNPRGAPLPLVCLALGLLLGGCGKDEPSSAGAELLAARDRAAEFGLWQKDGWADARKALEPIVARADASGEDLLRMACALLGAGLPDEALPYVERAAKLEPDSPVLHWCRFRIARIAYDNETALRELQEVRRLAPDDVASRLAIGMVLSDLAMDEPGKGYESRALEALETFVALPPETTAAWRVTALFRLSSLLGRLGEEQRSQERFAQYQRMVDQGIDSPGEPEHQPGTLGAIPPGRPDVFAIAKPAAPAPLALREVAGTAGARALAAALFAADPKLEPRPGGPSGEELWSVPPVPLDVVLGGRGGVVLYARSAGGALGSPRQVAQGDVLDVVPFDRGNPSTEPTSFAWRRAGDAEPDLLVALARPGGWELCVLERDGEEWTLSEPFLSGTGALAPGHVLAVDLDHEGDLDLVVASSSGVRVWRDDELDASLAGLTEVTAELPLPAGSYRPIAEDFDGDDDVDLLLVDETGGPPRWLSSERGWRFGDASSQLPRANGRRLCAADLDGTGFADLATLGDALRVHVRGPTGELRATLEWPLPAPAAGDPVACDWDLDGVTDVLWPTEGGGVAGVLAPGLKDGGVGFTLAEGRGAQGPCTLVVADLDGDFDQDVLVLDSLGLREGLGDGPRGALVDLRGYKDNARGVGARVEQRQGLVYRRIHWTGRRELVGGSSGLERLRVTWPNAVKQSYFDLEAGVSYVIWQRPGLVGSCPFLYAWDGQRTSFVTDVLGITPLGLPMAPGLLVPPDHDEYVLVKASQLAPRDGFLELQLTEELREVTYLDRVRLDAIDHPADVEVFPNERFTFPPFPEPHVHTLRAPLAPLSARDDQDRDWTNELAADDRRLASPFEALGGRFQGLARQHALELAFDPERVRAAGRLRLAMTGWFFWTDASVNMAAARHSGAEFVPPLLQIPDPEGGADGWRTVGEPLGFPAGKLKTIVVDVTELVNRDDARLRVVSTLRICWDSIRLATDADDAPLETRSLEPAEARLWERGFSQPVPFEGRDDLEWFDWERLAPEPRWNQHAGRYTRFGDTLPLVTAIDDRFVIMGAGDALTLRFDASALPPPRAGWTRDWLLFLDGWAKDRDPNTVEALHVEPLPFHAMSGYPYAADERFPDDEAHRAWQREWNTRPARAWIPPLASPVDRP